MRILGLDPGSKNFAWTLVVDAELIDHGYLIPVEGNDFESFGNRFATLLKKCSPEAVIFERFQVRGAQSHAAETVNCMLGYIMSICDKTYTPWYRITASQWKNYYKKPPKKRNPAPPKESDLKKPDRPDYPLKSHEADAACIAHYLETYWRDRFVEKQKEEERKRKRAEERAAKAPPKPKRRRTHKKKPS